MGGDIEALVRLIRREAEGGRSIASGSKHD